MKNDHYLSVYADNNYMNYHYDLKLDFHFWFLSLTFEALDLLFYRLFTYYDPVFQYMDLFLEYHKTPSSPSFYYSIHWWFYFRALRLLFDHFQWFYLNLMILKIMVLKWFDSLVLVIDHLDYIQNSYYFFPRP